MPTIGRILVLLCLTAPTLHAQSTEADIKARLLDKPLYLRGSWSDDNLSFDATGQLTSRSATTSFTLSGFDLDKLTLKHDKLLLEGHRVGIEFEADLPQRVPLNVGKPKEHKDERLHIEIVTPPGGDYTAVLDAVFADGIAQLAPNLPDAWQLYARQHHLSPATPTSAKQDSTSNPKRVGGGITPPRLLHNVDPEFNNAARQLRYSGNSIINLWVGPDGVPTHLSIVRPTGLGLDERAIEAVQKYTFSPATENGQPVTVEINVEVNFQIF